MSLAPDRPPGIRSVDSDTMVETLRARGLVTEDPRFGGRGPGFLVTTPAFLQYFGLNSLSSLQPRDRPGSLNRRCAGVIYTRVYPAWDCSR